MSFAWYCSGVPKPASKDEWATNALRFATKEEAEAYGNDLGSRWMAMGEGEVRETADTVNYTFDRNNGLRTIEEAQTTGVADS